MTSATQPPVLRCSRAHVSRFLWGGGGEMGSTAAPVLCEEANLLVFWEATSSSSTPPHAHTGPELGRAGRHSCPSQLGSHEESGSLAAEPAWREKPRGSRPRLRPKGKLCHHFVTVFVFRLGETRSAVSTGRVK